MATFKVRSRQGGDTAVKYPPAVLRGGGTYDGDLANPQAPAGEPLEGTLRGGGTYRGTLSDALRIKGGGTYRGDLVNQSLIRGGGTYRGDLRGRFADKVTIRGHGSYRGDLSVLDRIKGGGTYHGDLTGTTPTPIQFGFQRTLVVTAQSDLATGSLDHPLVRNLKLEGVWLKTQPTGRLHSTSAYDLVVDHSGGARMAHEVQQYDATNGRLWLNIKQGAYDPGSANSILILRYGSADQTTETQAPGTVWNHCTGVWSMNDGLDAVAARHLTAGSGSYAAPTGGTLPSGNVAGVFGAQNAQWKKVNPSFVNGMGSFTLELRFSVATGGLAADGLIFRIGTPTPSATAPAGDAAVLVRLVRSLTVDGTAYTNMMFVRSSWSSGSPLTRAVTAFCSPSNSVVAGEQVWHIVCQSGQRAIFYKDGVLLADGGAENATATGSLAVASADELTFGAASGFGGAPNNGLAMTMGRAVLYPRALGAGEIGWINRQLAASWEVVGISAEDARTDTNRGAVAVPMRNATTVNTDYLFDAAAGSHDPNNDSITLTAVGAGANGTASLSAGKIAYRPTSAGIDPVSFTVRDSQTAKTSSSFAVMVNAEAGEEEPDPGDIFAGHNGPMTNLTDTSVTPNVVHRVPSFMKGWERDTAWSTGASPSNGVRFRCPTSKRQFRFGQFNSGNNLEGYCNSAPTFHGANMIGYGADARAAGWGPTNSWAKIAGGPQAPTSTNPLTYSSSDSGNYPNNLTDHANFAYFNQRRATVAMGIYMTTLPFEQATATDVANAIATYDPDGNNAHKWYKAYFTRLKQESNRYGNPVLVLRPNWEGMTQDTGLQLANRTSWFSAGHTREQYNAMMRNFCRAGKEFGPVNMYIVISPSFEITGEGPSPPYPSYEDWLTDNTSVNATTGLPNGGPGTTAWVGYTGTCSSIHPDSRSPRNSTLVQAKSLITGGGSLTSRYYPAKGALDATVKYKIPFFSLEIGPGTPYTNSLLHNQNVKSKFYGDTFIELGQIINRANMYGLIGAFGFLDAGSNLFPTNPNATQSGVNVSFWDNADRENMLRCARAVRKHWGHKTDYGNDTIPDYSTRTD